MDSKADMYFRRAKTELETAEILHEVSKNKDIKEFIKHCNTYLSNL